MRALLAVLLIALVGCGAVFVGFQTNTGIGTTTFVTGTVTIVHVTVISGNVDATVVTLVANASANTLTFCGNNVSLFPIDGFVQVNFTPAQPCISSFAVKN